MFFTIFLKVYSHGWFSYLSNIISVPLLMPCHHNISSHCIHLYWLWYWLYRTGGSLTLYGRIFTSLIREKSNIGLCFLKIISTHGPIWTIVNIKTCMPCDNEVRGKCHVANWILNSFFGDKQRLNRGYIHSEIRREQLHFTLTEKFQPTTCLWYI